MLAGSGAEVGCTATGSEPGPIDIEEAQPAKERPANTSAPSVARAGERRDTTMTGLPGCLGAHFAQPRPSAQDDTSYVPTRRWFQHRAGAIRCIVSRPLT